MADKIGLKMWKLLMRFVMPEIYVTLILFIVLNISARIKTFEQSLRGTEAIDFIVTKKPRAIPDSSDVRIRLLLDESMDVKMT